MSPAPAQGEPTMAIARVGFQPCSTPPANPIHADSRHRSGLAVLHRRRRDGLHRDVRHRPRHRAWRFPLARDAPRPDAEGAVLGAGRRACAGMDCRPGARPAAGGGGRDHADGDLARRARRAAPIAGCRCRSVVRTGAADRRGRARGRLDAAVDRGLRRVLRRQRDRGPATSGAAGVHGAVAPARSRHADETFRCRTCGMAGATVAQGRRRGCSSCWSCWR